MVRHFSVRVLVITLAGALAGGVNNFDQLHLGKWNNDFGFGGMGAVFAVFVLGVAARMYHGRFGRRQWPRWLAAGGILAVGMPVSFFAGVFGTLVFGAPLESLFRTARSAVNVETGLGLLAASLVWSFAMTMALRVSLFRGIRTVSILLISTAWMFAWIELYLPLALYMQNALHVHIDFWLMFAGGQAISGMLMGYYLEKYLGEGAPVVGERHA